MTETIHLFVRPAVGDRDVYVTSPQVPGLLFGRPTLRQVREELDDVLAFHFGSPDAFGVIEHHERHYDIAGGELVTRLALDEHRDDRQIVYERIGAALRIPDQARSLLEVPTNKVGEVVYVCAVPSDSLKWLGDQLDPRYGDALMVTVAVSNELLFAVAMVKGEGYVGPDTIAFDNGSTVADVIHKVAVVGPAPAQHPAIRVPA